MKSSANEFKRCKPLLGTFVELTLSGAPPRALAQASDRAFAAIAAVERAMSFHDPASELSRLNSAPVGEWAPVESALREVLRLALELQRESGGRFNVAVGAPLAAWGWLPGERGKIDWSALATPGFEVRGARARRLHDVRIDLGGIAKGYAVDAAVRELRRARLAGVVNAGGDLRVFGAERREVWLRAGSESKPTLRAAFVRNSAVATSSVRPRRRPGSRLGSSAYVDLRLRAPRLARGTAVVFARSCVVADAFTKIALLSPPRAAREFARRYRAEIRWLS
jgi:thiamine biosynthesis lipoprotein